MANFIPKIIYNAVTITLTLPTVDDPFNEEIAASKQRSVSASGIVQASLDFLEEERKIKLGFLSKTLTDELRTFFTTWGLLEKPFDYYPSNDEGTFYTYTLTSKAFNPKRSISDGSGDFLYDLEISMRRVYT